MSKGPYLAAEDSALLRAALKPYAGGSCLEIGAGNGGTLVELAKGFERVVATDVARPGIHDWRNSGADYLLADAASCLRDDSFDLVAFNPPYLALEVSEDPAVEGGAGLEVPTKFLRDALRVVRRTGSVVMLLNSEARINEFETECARKGFVLKRIATRHMFFEDLVVYEASVGQIEAPVSPLASSFDAGPNRLQTEMSATSRLSS